VPYPEAVAFVRGDLDEEAFLEEAVRSTRRLVRRQRAWFRRDPRVRWFDGTDIAHATGEVRAYLEQHVDGGNACAS
jgi:tRNA dimethylallyltransferase